MRVVAISYGTEGDTRPFVALGVALREAGHDFLLAGEESGAGLAAAHGVPFLPLAGGLREQLRGDGELGEHVRRTRGLLAGIAPVRDLLAEQLHGWTSSLLAAAGDAEVLLASGFALPAGFTVADALGIPAVAVFFQPFQPTWRSGSALLPAWLPTAVQPLLFAGGQELVWGAFRGVLDDTRRRLGLPAQRRIWQGYPSLGAWSPTLAGSAAPGLRITGNWPLTSPDATLPDDVEAFLAEGEPPVYVGFGSMAVPENLLPTVLAGLAGRRVLLSRGWATPVPDELPDGAMVVGHLPHHLLFARVAAVVHHCGAGTSHAAVRAGVPSIPLPLTTDQPWWAGQLWRRGLATRPLAARSVTAGQVREAVLRAPACGPAVRRASSRMAAQDGAAAAIKALESLLA